MKRRLQKSVTVLFTLVMGLVVSTPVSAYDPGAGTFEVGAFAGYTWLDTFAGQRPKDHLLYGVRFGVFASEHASFEASYQLTLTDTQRFVGAQDSATFHHARLNLLHHFLPAARVSPFITGGVGWLHSKIDSAFSAHDMSVNAGAGLKVFITDTLALRADGRYVYAEVEDLRNHNAEAALGVSYFFGAKAKRDADGDGVLDPLDQCAGSPAGAKVDGKGCPMDSDADGVFDGLDTCENTPAGAKVDEKGCPKDEDGDGVFDGIDQCAATPKGTVVDAQGCVADADKDGVPDASDQCQGTPSGVAVDEKGCPKDSDGDTVTDDLDICPGTAAGVKVDAKGCPVVTRSRGVLQGVTFKSNSAELLGKALPILDAVAVELANFAQVKVEVQGHTDALGDPKRNQQLSQKRAEAVRDYLISKGIAADRLTAKGYGKDVPVASNKTSTGRAKNRRVELKWLD